MNYYVGIDLGTSSVKTLLLSGDGEVVSSVTKEYPLYFPQVGWSEQNPEDWYNQTLSALKELFDFGKIFYLAVKRGNTLGAPPFFA